MKVNKALVFDLWGDYAHFRKIYATTSSITYSIPTGTALAGLAGAILGLERDSFYDLFAKESSAFGVRIKSPVRKLWMNLNQVDTKKGFYLWDIETGKRTQIPTEFLKKPRYRVYLSLEDREMQDKLKGFLKNHKSVYTPYLGISELIADFEFVDEFPTKLKEISGKARIHSVAQKGSVNVIVEEGLNYGRERIPIRASEGGSAREFADVIYEKNGKPLVAKGGSYYEIGGDNVILF